MVRSFVFFLMLAGVFAVSGEHAPAQSSLQERGPEYVLQSGDSVEITYTYTPEYNQTVSVPSDGFVGLPRLGSVHIGGLTLRSAKAVILEAANKSGLNKPEVVLTLRDFVKPTFTVLGEVNRPGRYELRGSVRVPDALAIAGGLNYNARHKNIILIHRLNETEGETTLIDYKQFEKKHSEVVTETLEDGDIIVVPQGNLSKIEHVVKLANIGAYYPL